MNIQELKDQYGIRHSGRLVCPICGAHKTHYRLYGYRCHNPEHARQEEEFTETLIDMVTAGKISEAEYDRWCDGDEGEQP